MATMLEHVRQTASSPLIATPLTSSSPTNQNKDASDDNNNSNNADDQQDEYQDEAESQGQMSFKEELT